MICLLAANRGSNCSLRRAMDGRIVRCDIISSCQLAATYFFILHSFSPLLSPSILAERRLRMAGHIIRMPPGRPANHAMSWNPRGSGRRRDRPTKTWRSTFKEDLVDRGVNWNSIWAVATNRSRWQTLAAHCPVKDRRI